jgi:hypothetical protein
MWWTLMREKESKFEKVGGGILSTMGEPEPEEFLRNQ